MASSKLFDDTPYKSSQSDLEKLAEAQATAIAGLEVKLKKLEDEKANLNDRIRNFQSEASLNEAEAIQRCISTEFRLAQAKTFIPHKRSRLSKSPVLTTDQTSFLNPALNLIYRKAFESAKLVKTSLKQSYDDLIAWKFSPDSASGKRLMACMRQLLISNESLGRANEVDRISSLESEVAMQSSCIEEFIKNNKELEGVLEESGVDLEGLQSSLLILKQQLNQAEGLIEDLKAEYELHNPGQVESLVAVALENLNRTNQSEFTDNPASVEDGDSLRDPEIKAEENISTTSPDETTLETSAPEGSSAPQNIS